jgi:hypothetical protein
MASENDIAYPAIRVSKSDIERTFTNIKQRQVACMVDYYDPYKMICRVFSLPFKLHRLAHIGNNIPNIVFNSVTHLRLWDKNAFKHEIFIRLARAFPFLQNLSIWNIKRAFLEIPEYHLRHKDWCSIIEYPHLISLDIECVNNFMLTKTHLVVLRCWMHTYDSDASQCIHLFHYALGLHQRSLLDTLIGYLIT